MDEATVGFILSEENSDVSDYSFIQTVSITNYWKVNDVAPIRDFFVVNLSRPSKMMSKKQWFVLLCLFSIYLLLGAGIFYHVETREEERKLELERLERLAIENLLSKHCNKTPKREEFFRNLTTYCGKTISSDMSSIDVSKKWDFYNSLFFVITVVSTIGYGNLAPTTTFSRIFLIFYGLIGIPMNGIVMVTLGDYFGRSFTKLYRRWKTSTMKYDTTRLGLISQVILYSIPGFTFFIILPSVIMVFFEGWTYDMAVYYSFVTLTTIGFGDLVAGTENFQSLDPFYYAIYKIFLIVWIIGGLGYVIMILGFITRGMRSKKIQELEHLISANIRKTPQKIRSELRLLINEFLLTRVRRVYKHQFEFTPSGIQCTQSCPDLTIYRNQHCPTLLRKRALSECPRHELDRVQSDTDLHNIDKEMTFHPAEALLQQKDLLLKVVDAISAVSSPLPHEEQHDSLNVLSDFEISQNRSKRHNSAYFLDESEPIEITRKARRRAKSEVRTPVFHEAEKDSETTWYGQAAKELQKRLKSLTPNDTDGNGNLSFFAKMKNKLIPSKEDKNDSKTTDIEKQNHIVEEDKVRDLPSVFISTETETKSFSISRKPSDAQKYQETSTTRARSNTLVTTEGRFRRSVRSRAFSVDEPRFRRGASGLSVPAGPDNYHSQTDTGRSPALSMQQQQAVLENTSLAEFLRALTVITVPEVASNMSSDQSQRTVNLPQVRVPQKTRRVPIRPAFQHRRSSLMPSSPSTEFRARRLSLSPVEEHILVPASLPPPPYTPFAEGTRNGRFSVMPASTSQIQGSKPGSAAKKDDK